MAQDYREKEPGRRHYRVSLGSTAGLMTLFYFPNWIGRVIVTIMSGGADVKHVAGTQAPADAIDIAGREYMTIFLADGPRIVPLRSGPSRGSLDHWPPQFALAPSTATATTVELELEPWTG